MTRRYCYECGRDFAPGEKIITTEMTFWVFPADTDDEDAVESMETRVVDLCEADAAYQTKEA